MHYRRRTIFFGIIGLIAFGWLAVGVLPEQTAEESNDPKPRNQYSGNCEANGIEYRRQYSKDELAGIFGTARSPELTAQLAPVPLFGQTVRVHARVAACLEAVERERVARNINYVINTADPLGGIGGYRVGDSQLGDASYHTYGAAIDINPSRNPHCRSYGAVDPLMLCEAGNPTDIPSDLIQVFRNHGFTWGGLWRRNKDYMHFEWHGVVPEDD